MDKDYSDVIVGVEEASSIVQKLYNREGLLFQLDGEIDFNFRLQTKNEKYLLKISRPQADIENAKFQTELLNYIDTKQAKLTSPKTILDIDGKEISVINDSSGKKRYVRLLTWIEGRIYSSVNPQNEKLLFSLGEQAGKITNALHDFDHAFAHRSFEWDIAKVEWTKNYINLFDNDQQKTINHFLNLFSESNVNYNSLRKGVVHNDVNDNNIIVSEGLINPEVISVIDYGDSVYTQIINDLAICIAYGIMNKPNPLQAASIILDGYNKHFSIKEKELEMLYPLVAMRLIITVTKSAINKEKEPDNKYLQISGKPAWDALKKWIEVNPKLALCTFRETCSFTPNPTIELFNLYTKNNSLSIHNLFPSLSYKSIRQVDMSVASTFIGNESEYNSNELLTLRFKRLQIENPNSLLVGGYLEPRPIYITDDYKREGNCGPEFRCAHLGVDFWVEPQTPLHSVLDGTVFSVHNNSNDKDYGPTVIIEHVVNNKLKFYTLYGHLSESSLEAVAIGQQIKQGDLIGFIGNSNENGNWSPHLHFQIILDLLGNNTDFPGVAFSNEIMVWKSICPNPNLLFNEEILENNPLTEFESIISEREKYLGPSLSISYNTPLHIVRGEGQYLIDITGRKYLDTVNNVAHVGHENSEVVKAAQDQIAILNTNTRYLHENINTFAKELLKTFPKELSVVHFVNSGSEANELALRMAKTISKQKDIIAVEVGYHGNTSGCVDISSYKFDGKGGTGAPKFTHIVPLPDSYRGIYRGRNCGQNYAEHVMKQIEIIKSTGRNIAGFICESIISCGGQIELPEHYLAQAYKFVRDAGGICIADEVQVGCGRLGSKFWGFELHNVIPDIVTIGKPLGNGHPIAAVVCTKEIAEAFNNGMEYFNTFGGNPVSCAIGTKVLEIIKEKNLQKNALEIGNMLKNELHNLQTNFPIIGDVRGQGLFLGFELVDKNKKPEATKASYLVNRMRELGILMSTDGKDNNVIKIKPPMVITKGNVEELIFRITQVLREDFMRLNYD